MILVPSRAQHLPDQLESIGANRENELPVDLRVRSIFQTRRGRLVRMNGEKCQMASFGQSSRNPPPAKPQPTANGRR